MKHLSLLIFCSGAMCAGCARDLTPPAIPVYHPANAQAVEAPHIEAFEVLAITPALPPELPVTEGVQRPPHDPEKMGAMYGDSAMPGRDKMPGMDEMEDDNPGAHAQPEFHGVVEREGMRSGMPEAADDDGFPTDHAHAPDEAYRERLDDDIKSGEAPMQKIKVPMEQRGMGADSTLYHEHEHHDSTHITHPDRYTSHSPIIGPHAWVCPMHPDVVAATPGGRCSYCDAVLVPVKVDE